MKKLERDVKLNQKKKKKKKKKTFVVALFIGFMVVAILSNHNEVLIISLREVTVTRQSIGV